MDTKVLPDHTFVVPVYGLSDQERDHLFDEIRKQLLTLFANTNCFSRIYVDTIFKDDMATAIVITGLELFEEKHADFLANYLSVQLQHQVWTRNENLDVLLHQTTPLTKWMKTAIHPSVYVRQPYANFISATFAPEATMASAIRTCYSKADPKLMFDKFVAEMNVSPQQTLERITELYTGCMESGHHSVFEHFNVTFAVGGSRAMSHQLVRHRIASFSQQSQRYIEADAYPVVLPPTLRTPVRVIRYLMFMETQILEYKDMLADGVEKEDARFVFGNGAFTQLTITMNVRSLMNFFAHRCCHCAQWEIRRIATELLSILKREFPVIFNHQYMGAKCHRLGYCEEKPERSCRKYPLRADMLSAYDELRELKKKYDQLLSM